MIDKVLIREALVDTGSGFSMVNSALYDLLPSRTAINSFKISASDIVGVGGTNAEVRGYIDVSMQIAGIELAHPLLVVTNLSFSILIGMDVLQPHAAKMSLNSAAPLELNARNVTYASSNKRIRIPRIAARLRSHVFPNPPL